MNTTTPFGDSQLASTLALIGGTALGDTRNTLIQQCIVAAANKTGGTPGGSGDVVGPASSTANHAAVFASGTGKLLADSGITLTAATVGFTIAGGTTSKTLTVLNTGTAALLEVANAFTVAGAASTPALSLTGSIFTGGSASTTQPAFLIQPTGTSWTNGNTNGTALGINLASGSTSDLIHGLVDNATAFKATASGQLWLSGFVAFAGNGGSTVVYGGGGNVLGVVHNAAFNLGGSSIAWGTNPFGDVRDIGITRSAAGVLKATDGGAGYGTVDAAGYKVSGTAGANFSGILTNITIVNGLVTAAS